MAYATQAQALSYMSRLAKTTTGSSFPSTSDLATFIADTAGIIDAAVKSRGLTTPVTAPAEFVAELGSLNAKAAAAQMMIAAYITNDSNDRGNGEILWKQFTDRIAQIYKGVGVPVAVSVAEADLAPRSFFTDYSAVGSGGDGQIVGDFNVPAELAQPSPTDPWGDTINSEPLFRRDRRF